MTRVTNENLKVIKDAQKRAKALLRELKVGDPLEHGYGVCRELAGHDYRHQDLGVFHLYGAIAGILFAENDNWEYTDNYFPSLGVFTEQRRQFTQAIANTPAEILVHLIDRAKAFGWPAEPNTDRYSVEQVEKLQWAAQRLLKSKPKLGTPLANHCGACHELRIKTWDRYLPYDLFAVVSRHLYNGAEALPEYGVWTKQRLHLLRVYVKTPTRILTHLVNERESTLA